jgi:hypothetical protein
MVCTGDCNSDTEVTVDEVIVMVNISLDFADIAECPNADPEGTGMVTIDLIIRAVNNVLVGCR